MVVERKKVTYKESVFYVEHWPGLTYTECGKLNKLINCPFYEVMFRDAVYVFPRYYDLKTKNYIRYEEFLSILTKREYEKNISDRIEIRHERKNLERHRCLLLEQVYGVQTGNELWELCPGEKVEVL